MPDYSLCGWHLRSDRSLPLVAPLCNSSAIPDIDLKHGPIPQIDLPVIFSSPFITIYADNQALINVGETVSILVSDGRKIIVDAPAATPQAEVMTFLLGPALGMICHQRQILPLHAASIRIGNTAVALVGQSGAGKSTCATALIGRGHQLLCDDISVINSDNATVRPAFPAIKLWQDAAKALEIRTDELCNVRTGLQKFHYPVTSVSESVPTELRAIIILEPRTHIASAGLTQLSKINALAQLRRHIYRARLSQLTGAEQACFKQLGQLVSKVPTMLLTRPDNLLQLDQTINLIEEIFSA